MKRRTMHKLLMILPPFALAGCLANPAPVVVDYNGSSVKVQQFQVTLPTEADKALIREEAQRICATDGRRAEYASTTNDPRTTTGTHLFLCLK